MSGEIVVKPVLTKRELNAFIRFPWRIYRGKKSHFPNWVPPLIVDEKTLFNPSKNPFYLHAEQQHFLAYRGGEIVGRISGVVDEQYLEYGEAGTAYFGFFEAYFGEAARTFDYKWMRGVTTGQSTGSHYDVVYMGRGTVDQLFTVWTPLGDVPIKSGPLTICVGSHNLESFAKVRATYGGSDVDRDLISGWFSEDPMELVAKFGGQWLTTGFEAGDVLIFTMYSMHSSVANATDRFRLSTDTRFQPASAAVDERWVGENPIAHYRWKAGEGDTGPYMTPMREAREEDVAGRGRAIVCVGVGGAVDWR